MMTLFGIDPGFKHIGYAKVTISGPSIKLIAAGIIETEKSEKKRRIRATDDNYRRAEEIATELNRLGFSEAHAACAESMSHPRNASAAAKVAMCWGILVQARLGKKVPMAQFTPQEVKVAVTGSKSASKDEVAEAVRKRFPEVDSFLADIPPSKREHAYDAVAVLMTSFLDQMIKLLLSEKD